MVTDRPIYDRSETGVALTLTLMAGPATAKVEAPPADGACVAAGVGNLRGVIGTVARDAGPGAIAEVIIAHTNGDGSVSGADC